MASVNPITDDGKAGRYVFKVAGREIPYGMRPQKTRYIKSQPTGRNLRGLDCGFGISTEVEFIWTIMPSRVMNYWATLIGPVPSAYVEGVQFPVPQGTIRNQNNETIHGHIFWQKATISWTFDSELSIYNGELMAADQKITLREVLV